MSEQSATGSNFGSCLRSTKDSGAAVVDSYVANVSVGGEAEPDNWLCRIFELLVAFCDKT